MINCPGTRFGRLAHGLVRVALIVSLWQAPVPCIHAHEGFQAGATGAIDPALTDHLVLFHAGVDSPTPGWWGWHVHFALPGELLGCSPEDDSDSVPRPMSLCGREPTSVVANPIIGFSPYDSSPGDVVLPAGFGTAPPHMPPVGCGGSYLGTYLTAAPIGVLLCVARC